MVGVGGGCGHVGLGTTSAATYVRGRDKASEKLKLLPFVKVAAARRRRRPCQAYLCLPRCVNSPTHGGQAEKEREKKQQQQKGPCFAPAKVVKPPATTTWEMANGNGSPWNILCCQLSGALAKLKCASGTRRHACSRIVVVVVVAGLGLPTSRNGFIEVESDGSGMRKRGGEGAGRQASGAGLRRC